MNNAKIKLLIQVHDDLGIPIFQKVREKSWPIFERVALEIDQEKRCSKDLENQWYYPMRTNLLQWVRAKQDMPFARSAKERYLRKQQQDIYEEYKKKPSIELEKKIKRIEGVIEGNGVTDVDIEHAKSFPISDIIEVNSKGFALCVSPDHTEKTPSMYCKKNFAYCYGCGFRADTIALYMQVNGVTFVQAVNSLK